MIEQDIDRVMKRLDAIAKEFDKAGQRRQIGRAAAAPIRKAARRKAPRPKKVPRRTEINRGAISVRYAGRGSGRPIAWYFSGNLWRSVSTLLFKRSKNVFVGPKIGRVGSSGDFGKTVGRADGYYAQMVKIAGRRSARNFRDHVLAPAVQTAGGEAVSRAVAKAQQIFEKEKRKQGF